MNHWRFKVSNKKRERAATLPLLFTHPATESEFSIMALGVGTSIPAPCKRIASALNKCHSSRSWESTQRKPSGFGLLYTHGFTESLGGFPHYGAMDKA